MKYIEIYFWCYFRTFLITCKCLARPLNIVSHERNSFDLKNPKKPIIMKKITIATVFVLVAAMANANNFQRFGTSTNRIFNEEPISFVERGIEFFVFANGEFDFNTQQSTAGGNFYRGPRQNANAGNQNVGTLVEQDQMGRVRRVGNVFINYDAGNRIRRIGTVYMNYSNFGLAQVGNLRLIYDRRGQVIDYIGNVKGYRAVNAYSYNPVVYHNQFGGYNNSDSYFYKNAADDNEVKENIEKVDIK